MSKKIQKTTENKASATPQPNKENQAHFLGIGIKAHHTLEAHNSDYPSPNAVNFYKELSNLKEVNKTVITLYPSNPENRDEWKAIDEELQEDHISSKSETIIVKENYSLPLLQKKRYSAKIAMINDGYGKAVIYGKDTNDKKRIIKSDSYHKCIETEQTEYKAIYYEIREEIIRTINEHKDNKENL